MNANGAVIQQDGIALLLALLMLIAVLLLGATAARLAVQGEMAARADRDRYVAIQSAEDALHDAERELAGGGVDAQRNALLASGEGFKDGCGGEGAGRGLCGTGGTGGSAGAGAPAGKAAAPGAAAADGGAPAWQRVDLSADGTASVSVPYGQFTGAAMETGQGFLPFRQPRYIIERLPYRPAGSDAGAAPQYYYRVTTIGFGPREGTEVVLQTSYRKEDDTP